MADCFQMGRFILQIFNIPKPPPNGPLWRRRLKREGGECGWKRVSNSEHSIFSTESAIQTTNSIPACHSHMFPPSLQKISFYLRQKKEN